MVLLSQINKQKGKISCHYSPENSGEEGYVSIDTETEVLLVVQKTEFDFNTDVYIDKVVFKLLDLVGEDSIPEELTVAWY